MTVTNLETLSARKLHDLIAKRDARLKETLDATIRAGMGALTYSQVAEIAKGSSLIGHAELARAYISARQEWNAAHIELDRRKAWHGSDKPIRKRA